MLQTVSDWEMIIIDDGSKDDSLEIIKSIAPFEDRIKVVVQKNAGSAAARNKGIELAQGRYICFLDSDDLWQADYLETMHTYINECKVENAAVFFSGYRRKESECIAQILPSYFCSGKKTFNDLLFHCPIFPSAAIVDTAKLKEKIFFRTELKSLRDDYVFWLDITKQGLVCIGYKDILVDYRMRDDSVTSSKLKMIKPQWNVYRNVLKFDFFKSLFYMSSWALNGIRKYKKI